MSPPQTPYQPYAAVHASATGVGDARPTALQVVRDLQATGTLRSRAVVCTGCSSGIGVEIARALYEAGATLFLTARDTAKLEAVIDDIVARSAAYADAEDKPPRPTAILMRLDSLNSVRRGAQAIRDSTNSLHALVNNAGVMACPYATTPDGFETQLQTNHLAPFLLFHELQPLLLAGASPKSPSRVINLTSSAHTLSGIRFDDLSFSGGATYHKWLAYGQSKTANIYMANHLTRIYRRRGLISLSVHPGVIATELMRHMDREDHDFLENKGVYHLMKSPEQGAATAVWAVLAPHFNSVDNGGRYLADVGESLECAPYAHDEEREVKFWQVSKDLLNMTE